LRVVVAGDRIEVSGNVVRSKEKQTAGRIAQSFAGSRKVLNQIAISGGAAVPTPAMHSPEGGASRESKPENRGLVAPSPSPDKKPPPPLP
jgi:Flp pilus assembly secretin CpaC